MKTKFLVPVLAAIFAIGMSFTTEKKQSDPSQDYYQQSNGVFMPLGREIDCGNGNKTCIIELPDGQVYEVFDAPESSTLKKGDGRKRNL